jgi:hypothetical protein
VEAAAVQGMAAVTDQVAVAGTQVNQVAKYQALMALVTLQVVMVELTQAAEAAVIITMDKVATVAQA